MHAGNFPCHYWYKVRTSGDGFAGYTGPGWYFYDETEAFVVGPFESFRAGEKARSEYKP